MQSVTFAMPTLSTAQMSRQDQTDLVVNQATAAIVSGYLEHMNAALQKADPTIRPAASFLSQEELLALVNSVQTALRFNT